MHASCTVLLVRKNNVQYIVFAFLKKFVLYPCPEKVSLA